MSATPPPVASVFAGTPYTQGPKSSSPRNWSGIVNSSISISNLITGGDPLSVLSNKSSPPLSSLNRTPSATKLPPIPPLESNSVKQEKLLPPSEESHFISPGSQSSPALLPSPKSTSHGDLTIPFAPTALNSLNTPSHPDFSVSTDMESPDSQKTPFIPLSRLLQQYTSDISLPRIDENAEEGNESPFKDWDEPLHTGNNQSPMRTSVELSLRVQSTDDNTTLTELIESLTPEPNPHDQFSTEQEQNIIQVDDTETSPSCDNSQEKGTIGTSTDDFNKILDSLPLNKLEDSDHSRSGDFHPHFERPNLSEHWEERNAPEYAVRAESSQILERIKEPAQTSKPVMQYRRSFSNEQQGHVSIMLAGSHQPEQFGPNLQTYQHPDQHHDIPQTEPHQHQIHSTEQPQPQIVYVDYAEPLNHDSQRTLYSTGNTNHNESGHPNEEFQHGGIEDVKTGREKLVATTGIIMEDPEIQKVLQQFLALSTTQRDAVLAVINSAHR